MSTTLRGKKMADVVIMCDDYYILIKHSDSLDTLLRGAFLGSEGATVEIQVVEAARTKLPQSFMTWSKASSAEAEGEESKATLERRGKFSGRYGKTLKGSRFSIK